MHEYFNLYIEDPAPSSFDVWGEDYLFFQYNFIVDHNHYTIKRTLFGILALLGKIGGLQKSL